MVLNEPGRVILRDAGTGASWTPVDIDAAAAVFSREFGSVRPGHVVAFQLPNGPDWIACFLAILRQGAVGLPLDPGCTEPYARKLAVDAGAALSLRHTASGMRSERLRDPRKKSSALCLGKLTSGSTGQAKVCFFRDEEILADGRNVVATMGIRKSDVNFGHIPFGHSYGIGNLVAPLFLHGIPVIASSDSIPRAIWRALSEGGATVLPTVPGMLQAVAALDLPPAPSLRLVISAGSRLDPELAVNFRKQYGLPVHNFLGSSETGGIAYDRTGEFSEEGSGAVGPPMDGVRWSITATGRLLVGGPAVFTHGNRRTRNGVGHFLLRDKASIGPKGELILGGRVGKIMKIAGKRVDLGTFEQRCRQHPAIRDCVAAPLQEDRHFGALFVVRGEDFDPQAWVRGEFPQWLIPRRMRIVSKMPMDARGKTTLEVVRKALETPAKKS